MTLSVFILTTNRLRLLKDCLESTLTALPPQSEIIIAVNGYFPKTTAWLSQLNDPRVHWFEKKMESPGYSRNIAFEVCQGEIIYFLDDDVIVPRHLFTNATQLFRDFRDFSILGGPNLTPTDSSWNEKLYGAIMTSPFAAPMVRQRYYCGSGKKTASPRNSNKASHQILTASERELILCNLAIRRSQIPKNIRFRQTLLCNEENLFLYECRKAQQKIGYSTKLFVYHRRRRSLSHFLQQIFRYGTGRGQQTLKAPFSCHPAFLIPPVAVILGVILIAFGQWLILLSLIATHHLLSLLGILFSEDLRNLGPYATLLTIPLTLFLHTAYGIGFWRGIAVEFRSVLLKSRKDGQLECEPSPIIAMP